MACLSLTLAWGIAPRLVDAQGAAAGHGLEGMIVTVSGPIDPDRLGVTLMHEHLFIDIRFPRRDFPRLEHGISDQERQLLHRAGFAGPETPEQLAFRDRTEFTPDMLDGLRRGWMTKAWLQILDEDLVQSEIMQFRSSVGGAIVDLTPIGLGRDPARIRAMADATGLHLVMGSGWYRWPWHPRDVASRSVSSLADEIVRDITVGVGGTRIRAGIIGEIAPDTRSRRTGYPSGTYDSEEIKVLRAAARASRRTGAAISLHVNLSSNPPLSFLDILEEEGTDLRRVIVGHACDRFRNLSRMKEILDRGPYLQCDELGVWTSWSGCPPKSIAVPQWRPASCLPWGQGMRANS